jgi:membrane fusion protein (multidrug efflux system)
MKYAIPIVALAVLVGAGIYFLERGLPGGGRTAAPAPRAAAGRGQRQPPLVTVARVGEGQLNDTVDAIGTAKANESVTLTAKVTDKVERVHFDDGDFVAAGAVLVELRNQEQEAQRAEAQANLDDATSRLRRLRDLSKRGLAAASDLDTAQTAVAAARARLDSVVAQLQDRVVRAPFAGLLGFREVSPGTLITPATPIATLDDVSTIKLDFTVPETFLAAVSPGADVVARSASYPQREFEGVVRTVGSRVDPVTRAITVRAEVPNQDRALRPGMLLTVRVITAQRTALVIPESAVYQMEDRAYVYRVDASSHVHERQIKLGERRFGRVEVLDGLSAGDRIVTSGLVKLRDGMLVRSADENQALSGLPASRRDLAGAGDTSDF